MDIVLLSRKQTSTDLRIFLGAEYVPILDDETITSLSCNDCRHYPCYFNNILIVDQSLRIAILCDYGKPSRSVLPDYNSIVT